MADDGLTLKEMIEVPADLMVVPRIGDNLPTQRNWGKARPATAADLERLGYRHRDFMYHRLRALFDEMGLDPEDDRVSIMRYFVECVTHYDHGLETADRVNIRAIITGTGKVKV